MLGCVWVFSSCGQWGSSLVAMWKLLIAVTSFVVKAPGTRVDRKPSSTDALRAEAVINLWWYVEGQNFLQPQLWESGLSTPARFSKPVFLPLKMAAWALLVRCSPWAIISLFIQHFYNWSISPTVKVPRRKLFFNDYASLWLCYHNFWGSNNYLVSGWSASECSVLPVGLKRPSFSGTVAYCMLMCGFKLGLGNLRQDVRFRNCFIYACVYLVNLWGSSMCPALCWELEMVWQVASWEIYSKAEELRNKWLILGSVCVSLDSLL